MHFVRIGLGINVSKYTICRQKLQLSKRLATQGSFLFEFMLKFIIHINLKFLRLSNDVTRMVLRVWQLLI